MLTYNIITNDGEVKNEGLSVTCNSCGNVTEYTLDGIVDFDEVKALEIPLTCDGIPFGSKGFYLFPAGITKGVRESGIGHFKAREEIDFTTVWSYLPVFGLCVGEKAYLYIINGMETESQIRTVIKDGKYYFYIRFAKVLEPKNYESFSFRCHELSGKDSTYSGMAREYRKYKLENGFVSIKDRLDDNLKYMVESMLVRIRMGWKPVPCKVPEQTIENEPPMHVACTFGQVEKIMESYHNAGIEKAEFQLVGWNISGHDGRWPQALPVEPALGGEEGLKRLIATAKKSGYKLTCHTNSTDAYKIAENFRAEDMIHKPDGNLQISGTYWSGGASYDVCARSVLKLAQETLPAIKELGFCGNHYIDVITCIRPRGCLWHEHPVNPREWINRYNELIKYARDLFGGMSSEGAADCCLKHIDYSLYCSFCDYTKEQISPLIDELVPFWQIVFHGIVLSNPYARTINATLSTNPDDLLKVIEYGGRPTLYYYSKFVNNGANWMSDIDFTANDDEDIERCTAAAKKLYNTMSRLTELQYEFIDEHEKVSDGVYKVTYSDGTAVKVDYNNKNFEII